MNVATGNDRGPLRGLALFDEARRLVHSGKPADDAVRELIKRGVPRPTASHLIERVVDRSLERASRSLAQQLQQRGYSETCIGETLTLRGVPENHVRRITDELTQERRSELDRRRALSWRYTGCAGAISVVLGLHLSRHGAIVGILSCDLLMLTISVAGLLTFAIVEEARRQQDCSR